MLLWKVVVSQQQALSTFFSILVYHASPIPLTNIFNFKF